MFRPSVEPLETRETPAAAHPDLYLNVWVNPTELPTVKAPDARPDGSGGALTTPTPRAAGAVVFVGGWGSSMYQYS